MTSGLLWVTVVAGLFTVLLSLSGQQRSARGSALTAALAATTSSIWLAAAFVSEDWRYEYVADHTRSGIGTFPRLAGLWAGPEGSLLLWSTLVAWSMVIALHLTRGTEVWRHVAAIGGTLTAGYAGIVALVASPFVLLDLPAVDGLGLQPILEHPAMVWHPPLLYAGLVGLLVPSLIVAASGWAKQPIDIRRAWWAVPLGLLAAGLLSGARWAHAELGWGGYWAWDPIESAGLAAWLAGVAALHLRTLSGRAMVAVGVLPGLGALWATTLTRIGIVSSVHAFADRPALRVSLLIVAGVGSALLVGAVLVGAVLTTNIRVGGPSRARAGGWVLLVAALYVATGTYQPLIEAATSGDRLAIAGTYFARILWPVVIVGGGLAVRADRRWWPALAGGVVGAVAVPISVGPFGLALAATGGAVAASAASLFRSRRPGAVAHIGAGVLLIGVAGTLGTSVTAVRLVVDEPTEVEGLTMVHRSVGLDEGAVISTATALVEVDGDELTPSLVSYHLRGVSTAEVAHRSSGFDEIQVVLLNADADQARYRVNRFPRIHLVWIGGGLVVASLLFGQSRRRLRSSNRLTVEPLSLSPSSARGVAGAGGEEGGHIG